MRVSHDGYYQLIDDSRGMCVANAFHHSSDIISADSSRRGRVDVLDQLRD